MRLPPRVALPALAVVLTGGIAMGQGGGEDGAPALTSSITAGLSVSVAGQRLSRPLEPREPALLTLTLVDSVTGQAGRLGEARALIRHLPDGAEPCRDMTQRLRATGMAATGDYPLNGSLILTISADRHVALVDPLLPAARNTLAISPLPLAAPRLVSDPGVNLFAVQDGTSGRAMRIDMPDLALTPLQTAAGDYLHLDAAGLVAVGRNSMLRLGRGAEARAIALPEGEWRLERAGPTALFVNAAGDRRLVVPQSRAERFRAFAMIPEAGALGATRDGALAAYAGGAMLHLVNTATGRASPVPVGRPPRAVYFTPDGGMALAALDDGFTVAIVDTAAARLTGAITLQWPLADIVMTQNDGFLQTVNAGLQRFSLAGLRAGEGMVLRPVSEPLPGQHDQRAPWLPALVAMSQGEGILATGFGADSVARIDVEAHAAFNAPLPPPTPIRAGTVKALAAVARGFAEAGPGRYTAPFAARAVGPHVLVLADRLGKISACATFQVGHPDAVAARPKSLRLRLDPALSRFPAGEAAELALAAEMPLPPDAPEHLRLEVMDMASPWRARAVARKFDGVYRLALRFPHAGRFVVQPLAGPPFDGAVSIRLPEGSGAGP